MNKHPISEMQQLAEDNARLRAALEAIVLEAGEEEPQIGDYEEMDGAVTLLAIDRARWTLAGIAREALK